MNVSELEKLLKTKSISKEAFLQSFKNVQKGNSYSDESIFAKNFSQKELNEIYSKFDLNGDGQINIDDNITDESFSDGTMSEDDLNLLVKELSDEYMMQKAMANALASAGEESSAPSSSGGSVGGGSSPASGYNSTSDTNGADDSSPKSLENMSEAELEAQLQTVQGEISTAQGELDKYTGGSEPDSTAMDEAYKAYTEAIGEEKTAELEEVKSKVAEKEGEIAQKTNEIAVQQGVVANAEANYNSAKSKREALEAKLSSLDSANPEQASMKSGLEAEIATAKANEETAKQALDQAKEELENKNQEKTTLEGELQTLNTELQAKEEEVTAGDEQIKALQEAYDKAKQDYDTKKAEGIKQAQDTIQAKNSEMASIKAQQQKIKDNTEINQKYPTGSLNGQYTLNGVNYDTVIPKDELDRLVQNALNKGAANKFGHSGKCLGFSDQYCLSILGMEDGNFSKLNLSNSNDYYKGYTSDDKEEVLKKVEEQINKNIPVILQVSTQAGSRHYVAVVGRTPSSAGSKLKESDLLIWDSYDGQIKGMAGTAGGTRHMITGYSTGNSDQRYGYQMFYKT